MSPRVDVASTKRLPTRHSPDTHRSLQPVADRGRYFPSGFALPLLSITGGLDWKPNDPRGLKSGKARTRCAQSRLKPTRLVPETHTETYPDVVSSCVQAGGPGVPREGTIP